MRNGCEGHRCQRAECDPHQIRAESRSQGVQEPHGRGRSLPYVLQGAGTMKQDVRRSANLRPVYVREGCLSSFVSLYGQYTDESLGSKCIFAGR